MMCLRAFVLFAVPALGAGASSEVRVSEAGVSVEASFAPLSEVLDRFARQTGTRLSYEGNPPRQLVSLKIEAASAAAALAGLLEGQALDYALALDVSGRNVTTLIVGSPSRPGGGSSGSTGSVGAPGPGGGSRPGGAGFRGPGGGGGRAPVRIEPEPRPVEPALDADEEVEDDEAEPEAEVQGPPPTTPPSGDDEDEDAEEPQPVVNQPPGAFNRPGNQPPSGLQSVPQSFPVSPFAPQPHPLYPQPVVPVAIPTPTPEPPDGD